MPDDDRLATPDAGPGADADAAYAAIWQAFERLDRPADAGADWKAWAAPAASHGLVLIPVSSPDARAWIQEQQRALLDVPGVELLPPAFLHVSLQSLGFSGRDGLLASSTLAGMLPRLRAALGRVPAFELHLGGSNAFHSSAFLEVRPAEPLDALRTAVRQVLGEPLARIDPYPSQVFHLTLAYFDGSATTTHVRRAIQPARARRGGRLRVDAVDVVVIPTDQRDPFPSLEPLARFPLGAARPRVDLDPHPEPAP